MNIIVVDNLEIKLLRVRVLELDLEPIFSISEQKATKHHSKNIQDTLKPMRNVKFRSVIYIKIRCSFVQKEPELRVFINICCKSKWCYKGEKLGKVTYITFIVKFSLCCKYYTTNLFLTSFM